MITYSEALEILRAQSTLLNTEHIGLDKALGRVCAETLLCPEPMPAFANSAVDGFAIQTASLTGDSTQLSVISSIAAGDAPVAEPLPHHAYEIMTGAVVPEGYDAVIPIEAVELIYEGHESTKQIIIKEILKPKQNIRYPGEDFQVGDVVINKGSVIEPAHMMILASLGLTLLTVYCQPQAAILSSGNELVSENTQTLEIGQIRNSNGIYVHHALQRLSISAQFLGSFPDDSHQFKDRILQLLSAEKAPDLIITTGAVSAGQWDFIPSLLREIKADILFHKVAIRPGKPILAARLSKKTLFVGLPGNPISTAVGLRFFVYPLLREMHGRPPEKPILAKLASAFLKKTGFHTFCKANAQVNASGELIVHLLQGQESFKMKPLLEANCWAALSALRTDYQQNELIEIYPLEPLHGNQHLYSD